MLAFSLAFQISSRYIPEYIWILGAIAGVICLYGSFRNFISAVYPYPGGAVSDRIGSRLALTAFATLATVGFGIWYLAAVVGDITLGGTTLPAWTFVFVGLFLAQAWKSFGLGATFAIVKQSVPPTRLAMGFASTEVFRRLGFLIGPLVAAGLLAATASFVGGFQLVLLVAVACGAVATVAQHYLYDASEDSLGKSFEGISQIVADLREMPATLRPLLVADTLVRFANGMVYVFFVIVVTQFLSVGFSGFGVSLRPDAFFGVLLGVEMVVAILSMAPVSKLAEYAGLKPVVALGSSADALCSLLRTFAPADQWMLLALFAYSGLRFAGLPAHKALIVGPARADAGGRVTGSYYLIRNALTIPSAAIGGWLYGSEWALDVGPLTLQSGPKLAFGAATAVGVVGVAYFILFGREFQAYE
jgi:MFS family permease